MRRVALSVVIVVLSAILASGCAGKNGKKDSSGSRDASSAKEGRTPDAFESSEDPPLNANTRFAAGQLAESQNEIDKAVTQYREALKLDPKHHHALFRLAALLTKQRHFPEAIAFWQKYIEVTNRAPAAYNNLAFCYELAGQVDKAEETYRAGIASSPQETICRVNYGLMLARQNRLDDAAAQLATALKPAEVSYNLGSVFEQQGKIDQAKAYYRKALEQDPSLRDARAKLEALH